MLVGDLSGTDIGSLNHTAEKVATIFFGLTAVLGYITTEGKNYALNIIRQLNSGNNANAELSPVVVPSFIGETVGRLVSEGVTKKLAESTMVSWETSRPNDKRGVTGSLSLPVPFLPVTVVGSPGTDRRGRKPTWGAGIQVKF